VATTRATGGTTSDWSLLRRIALKDEEALSALYDRYSGLVFSAAKRIVHRTGEAAEILQDVFYQVWRTAERFDQANGSLAGWLLVAVRNRAMWKLCRKTGPAEKFDEDGVALNVEIESRSAQNLLLEKVHRVIVSLSDLQRAAIECAYFEGLSHPEIAQKTGQPQGAVKTCLHSAMEALKKVLS
jgi:RNA polymerase sigma-70 factor, ECF subfamily